MTITTEQPIDHFFYFTSEEAASYAASELAQLGHKTQTGYRPDGKHPWFVATIEIAPEDISMRPLWEKYSALAEKFDGVYDGWGRPADNEGDIREAELKPFPRD